MGAKKKKIVNRNIIYPLRESNPRSLAHMSGALPMSHSVHDKCGSEKTYRYAFSSQRLHIEVIRDFL